MISFKLFKFSLLCALLIHIFVRLSSVCGAQTAIHLQPSDISRATAILEHLHDGTTVRFSGGTYFFTNPIDLPGNVDLLTLEPENSKQVELSAGQLIQGWKRDTLNGHACVSAALLAVKLGMWNFHQLWVNGRRATCCRYPAKGYLGLVAPADDKNPWNQGQREFEFKAGDVPDSLPPGTEAVVMNRWEESHLPIDWIDPKAHLMHSTRRTVFQLQNNDPYFLQGAQQWFQHAGDWYLDRKQGVIYYLPMPGEEIANLRAVAPTRDQILRGDHLNRLTLRGLHFSGSEWNFPEALPGDDPVVGGFGQAAIGVSAAVQLHHCTNSSIESCSFEHMGNYALELSAGSQSNRIDRCIFSDLGAGAIKVGETEITLNASEQTSGNTIADCRISNGGQVFPSACGIWVGQSPGNTITHNELWNLFYTAISIGWTWGYGPSLCRDNLIEANLIHDIGKRTVDDEPILSDMGAIYTLGARKGTVISGNVFHDIAGRVYGGWGIYLDEGSSNVLVEKNVVYRTTHGGFHLNYGQNNIVRNNIFALNRDLQIARTRNEPGLSFSFNRNVVLWDSGVFTETDPGGLSFDQNILCCIGQGKLRFGDKTFQQWQAAGQDVHSILKDPGFINAAQGNFKMSKSGPVSQIHFESFSTDQAGPRDR